MATTKWLVDPAHSEVQFKVKHLMITTVTGYFRKFDLVVETEEDDFTKANSIVFTADINSIDTNNNQRDTHLKSQDFFAAEQYGQLKFVRKKFEKSGDHYLLHGDLTIRDLIKPLSIEVEYAGTVVDPYGQTKAGFTLDTKLKRKDFKLSWDAVTEAGQVVVSNDIKVHGEIQLIKQVQQEQTTGIKEKQEAEL